MNSLQRFYDAIRQTDRETRLRWGIGVAALLFLAVILVQLHDRTRLLERKRQRREADLVEMMKLRAVHAEAKAEAQRLDNRMIALKAEDSPAKIVEDTGIRGKSTQVRPVKGEERPGFAEDAAEIRIEGVTANDAVNLLHRLESGSKPVTIRKALLRTRFDDPSRLDVTLTLAVLRPAARPAP